MNLDNKKFVTLENKSGLSSNKTIFHYSQKDEVITGNYEGGAIQKGLIIGKLTDGSKIELLYQCLTTDGALRAGESKGSVSKMPDGKLKLELDWNWLNGDQSGGMSKYIEIS